MWRIIRKALVWIIILALVAGGVWFFAIREKDINFAEETARIDDVETFYTFTGNVESTGSDTFVTGVRNKIKTWLVEEGDLVEKNDQIVRYDNGTVVRASMGGTVSDLYLDEGDEFTPGTALYRIADYSDPVINFKVDEYDVHALHKGMKVTVRVLSSGTEYEAEITRVSQEATVAGDLAYYAVRLTLPQDGTLPMGVTCEIIVPRENAQDVVTVSVGAIQYDDDGKPFVYTYDKNNAVVEQSVILGVNDGRIVEVKGGLNSGDTVLIPPTFGFDPAAMRQRMMEGWQ